MKKKCTYLKKYKEIIFVDSKITFYQCSLSEALLREKDLLQSWACKGCIIPEVMENNPCIYLKPKKVFTIRGSSCTKFICTLFNLTMKNSTDFCKINCKVFSNKLRRKFPPF